MKPEELIEAIAEAIDTDPDKLLEVITERFAVIYELEAKFGCMYWQIVDRVEELEGEKEDAELLVERMSNRAFELYEMGLH